MKYKPLTTKNIKLNFVCLSLKSGTISEADV